MVNLITNVGEEYLYENNADGDTVKIGLYEDATDALGEIDNLSAVTTEPTGSAYSRQSDAVAGDGSATDNLIAAGDLSQSRDLSSVDTLNIPAGELNIEGA